MHKDGPEDVAFSSTLSDGVLPVLAREEPKELVGGAVEFWNAV